MDESSLDHHFFLFFFNCIFFACTFSAAAMASQDTQNSLLNSVVQQEIAQRRQRVGIQRQDTRLSVKSLIESIEKSSHVKASNPDGISGSHCSSSSSINSMMSDAPMSTRHSITEWSESIDQTSQVKCFLLHM